MANQTVLNMICLRYKYKMYLTYCMKNYVSVNHHRQSYVKNRFNIISPFEIKYISVILSDNIEHVMLPDNTT